MELGLWLSIHVNLFLWRTSYSCVLYFWASLFFWFSLLIMHSFLDYLWRSQWYRCLVYLYHFPSTYHSFLFQFSFASGWVFVRYDLFSWLCFLLCSNYMANSDSYSNTKFQLSMTGRASNYVSCYSGGVTDSILVRLSILKLFPLFLSCALSLLFRPPLSILSLTSSLSPCLHPIESLVG